MRKPFEQQVIDALQEKLKASQDGRESARLSRIKQCTHQHVRTIADATPIANTSSMTELSDRFIDEYPDFVLGMFEDLRQKLIRIERKPGEETGQVNVRSAEEIVGLQIAGIIGELRSVRK